jgi:hypothetical protein
MNSGNKPILGLAGLRLCVNGSSWLGLSMRWAYELSACMTLASHDREASDEATSWDLGSGGSKPAVG